MRYASGLLALRTYDHDLAGGDSGFLFNDAALHALSAGLLMLLHHCHAFNDDLALGGERLLNLTGLALIFTGDYHYGIAGLYEKIVHFVAPPLQHFGSQRNDLHIILFAELARDGPKDTGALGLLLFVDDNRCVVVEADIGAVGSRTTVSLE